jgi:hypothetical protein
MSQSIKQSFKVKYNISTVMDDRYQYIPYGLGDIYNVFPQYLTFLAKSSPTLQNCIGKKSTLLIGNGFDDNFEKVIINKKGENVLKLLRQSAIDLVQYGGFSWKMDFNALGEVTAIYHLPFELVRVVAPKNMFSPVEKYAILNKYEKYNTQTIKFNATFCKSFNVEEVKEIGLEYLQQEKLHEFCENYEGQILYVADLTPGNEYYPTPCYSAASEDIESEVSLSSVRIKAIKDGFKAQTIITLLGNANPNDDQKEEDTKNYENGIGVNGDNLILQYAANAESKPLIDSVPVVDISRTWEVSENSVQKKIRTSFDIPEEFYSFTGKSDFLGDSEKFPKLLEYVQKVVLNHSQKLLSNAFEQVFSHWHDITQIPKSYEIQNLSIGDVANNDLNDTSTEKTSKIVASNPEQAKAQASLRGSVGGVTAILEIQKSVSEGTTQYDSAIIILKEIYGFTEVVAKQVLGTPNNINENTNNPTGL